jgi:DNA-binding beta-propeller fold protein YncE
MLIPFFVSSFLIMPSGRFIKQIDGFLEPSQAIWLDDGNIAVADRMANQIIVVTPEGKRLRTTPWDNPKYLSAKFGGTVLPELGYKYQYPTWPTEEVRKHGIAVKTNLGWIIPDELGHAIHHYDLEGNWLGKWGVHALLPHEGEGKLHYPNAVDVSFDGTKIVVCEGFEGRIQIFELGEGEVDSAPLISNISHFGKHVDSFGDLILIAEPELGDIYLLRTGLKVPIVLARFGGEGKSSHHFDWVNGLWIGDGEIKVLGDGNLKTFIFDHDSESSFKQMPGMVKLKQLVKCAQQFGSIDVLNNGEIFMSKSPFMDIALSQDEQSIWMVDSYSERIVQRTWNGDTLLTITGFIEPYGIEVEADGNILVSDIGASNIKRFSPQGELLLTFGEKGYAPHQMYKPAGITALDDGTIVVVDWGNHRAQLYSPEGKWQATFGRGRSWTRENNPPPHIVTSNAGNWKVTFSPTPEEMPLNEIFELTTTVEGEGEIKSLRVDAAMPAHGHGMMTDPITTLQSDGSYKTTGMLLSMPGHWEIYFDIDDGKTVERAQDSITLAP